MRLPRMTTRRWMIAAAVVGALAWVGVTAWKIRRNFLHYRNRIAYAKSMETEVARRLANAKAGLRYVEFAMSPKGKSLNEPPKTLPRRTANWTSLIALRKRQIAYYQQMQAKYERASRHPWLPVPPDPPEPK